MKVYIVVQQPHFYDDDPYNVAVFLYRSGAEQLIKNLKADGEPASFDIEEWDVQITLED